MCGKYSLVQKDKDEYCCLCCGFHQEPSQSEGGGILLISTILVFVLMGLLSNQDSLRIPKSKPANSPHVSSLVMWQDLLSRPYL